MGDSHGEENSARENWISHRRVTELIAVARAHLEAVGGMALDRKYESALGQLDIVGRNLDDLRAAMEAARALKARKGE